MRAGISRYWRAAWIGLVATVAPGIAPADPLSCTLGPLHRIYGGTQWLVYGCADHQSLMIGTTPDNPAAPYAFFIRPALRGYRILGSGTGNAAIVGAALAQLQSLTVEDVKSLLLQTEGH